MKAVYRGYESQETKARKRKPRERGQSHTRQVFGNEKKGECGDGFRRISNDESGRKVLRKRNKIARVNNLLRSVLSKNGFKPFSCSRQQNALNANRRPLSLRRSSACLGQGTGGGKRP
ncbi:MAG: hypothetical protein CBD74_11530 [Saprospirales bacterium TMED214]|nr:MAG: hypothetical protein CBD74_11530 [Saprospirales bacterium TMED214]